MDYTIDTTTPRYKAWSRRYHEKSLIKHARALVACAHEYTTKNDSWCVSCGAGKIGDEWTLPSEAAAMLYHFENLPKPKAKAKKR